MAAKDSAGMVMSRAVYSHTTKRCWTRPGGKEGMKDRRRWSDGECVCVWGGGVEGGKWREGGREG